MATYRHNCRNECIQLRALLKLAYKALRQNRCLVPRELVLWMRAQKEVKPAEDVPTQLTPDRVQQAITKFEITEDDIREAVEREI